MAFPKRDQLTTEMEKCFRCNTDFICTWVPWTWKTVIAFHKYKDLKQQWLNVKFICFNRLLNNYLTELWWSYWDDILTIDSWFWKMKAKTKLSKQYPTYFLETDNAWIKHVFTEYINILWKKFDRIVIDEWQDLWINFYRNSHILADNVAVFMDDHQKLKWTSILIWDTETQLYEASWRTPHRFTLTRIFRSPKKVYEFAKAFIPHDLVANDPSLLKNITDNPKSDLKCFDNTVSKVEKIKEILDSDYNVWKSIWIFWPDRREIGSLKTEFCNKYGKERESRMANYNPGNPEWFSRNWKILLSNFDCAKWLEFDTVILLAPSLNNDDLAANKLYTLCTRSKENLYVFMK